MSSDKYDQIIAAARAGKPADLLDVVGDLVRDRGIELVHAKYSLSAELGDETQEEELEAPEGDAVAEGNPENKLKKNIHAVKTGEKNSLGDVPLQKAFAKQDGKEHQYVKNKLRKGRAVLSGKEKHGDGMVRFAEGSEQEGGE